MRKLGIALISVLLVISISASGIGYYYSIYKTNDNEKNNNTTDNTGEKIDSELKEYFNKIGKSYNNIYTIDNTELKDFTFDSETEKLFMDNIILKNLEYFDFSNSFDTEKYRDYNLINNWLFVYIVKDENITEGCFSKDLLTSAYENIFDRENLEIEKLFNENEITNNYVCYSKKNSDIKEYKYKEAKRLNFNEEDPVVSYYEVKDINDKTHNIGINVNESINTIYAYNNYEDKNKIENIIKDREFDKQTEVGGSYTISAWGSVNYLKDKGSYDLENEVNIILNNGKLTFKHNNKEETVSINNVVEVVIDGEGMTQSGSYKLYFLNNSNELYYYDEVPYDGDDKTLEERVKNYKKIELDKEIKNFVFRRNEASEYYETKESYNVLEILLKLEDNTLYSIKNNKIVDYLLSSNNNVNIYENNDIENKNVKLNYKFKSILDMEYFTIWGDIDYFVTEDDYLYDIANNKLVSNSKIDKIYKSNEEDCDYSYLITFKNNEAVSIVNGRCS